MLLCYCPLPFQIMDPHVGVVLTQVVQDAGLVQEGRVCHVINLNLGRFIIHHSIHLLDILHCDGL